VSCTCECVAACASNTPPPSFCDHSANKKLRFSDVPVAEAPADGVDGGGDATSTDAYGDGGATATLPLPAGTAAVSSTVAAASAAAATTTTSAVLGEQMQVVLRIRPLNDLEARAVAGSGAEPCLVVESDTSVRVAAPEVSPPIPEPPQSRLCIARGEGGGNLFVCIPSLVEPTANPTNAAGFPELQERRAERHLLLHPRLSAGAGAGGAVWVPDVGACGTRRVRRRPLPRVCVR